MGQKDTGIWRKIEEGRKYRIWRKDFNGKTFYNICITQKNYDNTETKFYVPVTFKKGISVDNMTDIKIISGTENLRVNNNVEESKRQYYPVFSYMITEFEKCEREEQVQQQAFDNFRANLDENESSNEDPFY